MEEVRPSYLVLMLTCDVSLVKGLWGLSYPPPPPQPPPPQAAASQSWNHGLSESSHSFSSEGKCGYSYCLNLANSHISPDSPSPRGEGEQVLPPALLM